MLHKTKNEKQRRLFRVFLRFISIRALLSNKICT